jgi:hypothetical protein
MSNQRLIRLAAAALIVAAVSLTFGRILHPADELAGWTSPLWGPSHVLWLVGLVTGMIGVVGLYLRQRQEVRLLGLVGAGLAWIGMALLSGAMYFEAVIWPDLLVQTPAAIESLGDLSGYGTYLAVFLVSVASFGVGFLIFGIAMLRASLLPRWAIILVIIGAVIGGPQGFLPPLVATLSFVALGVGLVGLGFWLWGAASDPYPATGDQAVGVL